MKRTLLYSFIFLILLNVVGYNGLFFGLQYHNESSLHAEFDRGDYNNEASVTLKIPLALPYSYDGLDFDRINGLFEFAGETYRLVEKKLEQDTLHIVCVIDHRQKQIDSAFASYVKTFQDTPGDNSSSIPSVSFIKDYLISGFSVEQRTSGWISVIAHRERPSNFYSVSLSVSPLPPEQVI